MDTPRPTSCHLHFTLGHVEACPEAACPFWEENGDAGCALELLGPELERPDVARYLLGLRARFEAREGGGRQEALAAFAALVPPELIDR